MCLSMKTSTRLVVVASIGTAGKTSVSLESQSSCSLRGGMKRRKQGHLQVEARGSAEGAKPLLPGSGVISANLGRISRMEASPIPTIHGPDRLTRGLVGATLAVALGGGGVWLKFALMGIVPPQARLRTPIRSLVGAIPCGRPAGLLTRTLFNQP